MIVEDVLSSVADNFEFLGEEMWCPRLHENLNDWEWGEWLSLLELLGGFRLCEEARDCRVRGLSKKGSYTTKSFYEGLMLGEASPRFFRGIWIWGIPLKINFFI